MNCAANATLPTAPPVKDACGNDITPTVVAPNPIACNGTMVYTFTYKDCAGHSHDWTYTYTIDAPDFTLPVNGASTVNCAANATLPTAPPVKDACGNDITPTVVAPNPIACNGTMVYTFTYKDCAGHSHDWTYTYTIDAPDFTLPVNGASTVNCAANATLPTAPPVKDACGNDITPTVVAPNPIACNGTMVYTFTYKDCAGHSHDWTYTYTIDAPDFTLPVNGASTVNCAANATLPTAPPVKDACGNDITPTVVAPNPIACNGTMVYTFTYKDCAGHSHDWTYTYTIDAPDFTLPVNGASTVNCAANATLPTAPPVKDACGNDITPTVVAPNPIACNGTMVYTFTYKDCAGHSHDWTYTYTIDAPDFTLPVNGASTVNCAANATLPTAPPVKDACGNDITPTVVAPNPIACNGTMVYTFTYKDCAGHSHDWTYTYTIDAPDFTLPVNGASTVNCAANATLPTAPPVKDACGNDITPTVVAPNPIACNGTMVYTFTYKDCAGHSHDWTYTYTIDAPDFTLPVNGASTVNCAANATLPTAPPVKDACGNDITPTVVAPNPIACNGTMVYTFTYKDCAGHSHDWTYTYTIDAPDFTLPVNGASTVNCAANATLPTAPPVKDACGNDITPTVVAPNPIACNGTMVYTFTYKDCAGHSHDWTYTYTIDAPDFTLPVNGASTVNCAANATLPTAPPVKDACGNDITPTVVAPNPIACNGTMVYTFTYKDCAGHSHDWTYTYTIDAPDFTLPVNGASTVNCAANATLPTAPPVKDACGNDITPTVVAPNPIACNGTMVYTFTYKDCAGHSHDWTYTYTIDAPDFTLPVNGASTVNCAANATLPTAPTVKDACGNDITPTVVAPNPIACNGTMVYTFTYKDCAGHSHDWTYTYTIDAPDFTLPVNGASTVNCAANATLPTAPTVKDACGNDITPTVVAPNPIACNGTMVYTFTYKDCAGHSHDWTYTYTIDAPDFTLPVNGASTVNCAANATLPTAPTVKDACGNDITPTVVAPNPIACNGTMVYTFTYKDCAGHSHDWTYTYTIDAPDFTLPVNGASTVNCAANATLPTAPTVKDACGNDITPTVVAPNPIACNGTMVYTFTYKDCAGHSHDWTYTYTIDAPDFTLPVNGASTVNCAANATLPTAPTVKDACGNDITPTVVAPNPIACNGTMVYTFTYKDCAGHSHDWTYTYTVQTLPPQITFCPANLIACETEASTYVIPTLAATDNCGKPLTITYDITGATNRNGTGDASGVFGVGTSTIVWTVSNGCMSTTCTTTVTINPLPAPSITPSQDPACVNTGTVTYSTPQVGCNTYSWTISEGGTIIGSNTGNSIVVQWTTPGKKTVTVTETVCGTGCSKMVTKDFTVNPKPITTPITHD